MNSAMFRNITLAAAIVLAVSACGGGTGGTGSGDSGSGGMGVSIGVMTKGSVIVNGVQFEDTTANIFIDDRPKTAAALQNGMVVKVLGTVNANGITGIAQRVKALIEVRGRVTAIFPAENPQRFVVFDQNVIVDDLTLYSNLAGGFAGIDADPAGLTGTLVEVHGLRDTTGNVRATRVEANTLQMGDSTVDEIRGIVSGRDNSSDNIFSVGTQPVNASLASFFPSGATFANGDIVEVHCTTRPCVSGGVFQASRIVVESAEDSLFQPSSGQRFEAEGLISGFTVGNPNFSVAGTPVATTGSTRFQGGISTDLANNVKVEAEGTWNGSKLVASKIEFKRSVVRLQGVVTTSTSSSSSFTLTITGAGPVTVQADGFTSGDFAGGAVPPVVPGVCIQVRGQRKSGSGVVVTAGEIRSGCSSSSDHLIQAPVEVESGTTLTLLGFAINVGSPTDSVPYQNIDESPMTSTAFFNAVVPANPGPPSVAGTLVKVRFDTPQSTVKQVELED